MWTGEECILYYDASDGLGAVRSRDLETWEDATRNGSARSFATLTLS